MLPDYPIRQREFLLEISRAITAQLDLTEVLRRVLKASTVMMAGRMGFIALRDPETNRYVVRAILGIPSEAVPDLNHRLHDIMLTVQSGSSDYDSLNVQLKEMASEIDPELRQSIAMPLVFAEEPLGLLIVFRSYYTEALANDIQILQSFANQAAIAVNNAQLYERINHERQQLQTIITHSGDGVVTMNAKLEILQVNPAFETMTAWSAEHAIGLHHDDVIIWEQLAGDDLITAMDKSWLDASIPINERSPILVAGELMRLDGATISLGITYAPLWNGDGELAGVIGNTRDITHIRKAQEMQNTFISTVSHELRTPVTLIKGYASTLRRDDVIWDPEIAQQSLAVIEDEADRLGQLIDDLLVASKIQAEQTMELSLSDVRLDVLASRAAERFRTQTNTHEIVVSFPPDFPLIVADEKRLRQVIDNLLMNAIKYAPDGGTITIGGRASASQVTLFVRDEGVGIAEDEQAQIFDRFYRVDDNLSRSTQGTGVGFIPHQGDCRSPWW